MEEIARRAISLTRLLQLSPMPHSRLQLHSGVADALNPLTGKVIKRGCKVEQQFVAGWNASAVYWKVVD